MEQNIAQNYISHIKKLLSQGVKIKDLAKRYGVNKSTIRRWLNGTMTPSNKRIQESIPFISGIFIGEIPNTESINSGGFYTPNNIPSHFYTPTPNKVNSKQEELLEFLTTLAPIYYDAPKIPTVYQKANKIAVVGGDFHFGMEDQKCVDLFLKTVEALRPQKVILNGDTMDFLAVSRYPKDLRYTCSLSKEREAYHKFLKILHDITAPYNAEIIETQSNHSGSSSFGRYFRFLSERIPELKDLPEVIESLSYENIFFPKKEWSRIKLVDFVEIIPEFIVIHGDVVRGKSAMSAHGMMDKWSTSLMMNHTHRLGSAYKRLPQIGSKKEQIIQTYENGCLCQLNPSYASTSNWQNGFSIINYSDTNVAVEQCLIENNTVAISTLGKTLKA